MFGKIVLWLSAAIFASYGLWCLVSPEVPANYAGLTITNGDAYAEMGAMYGGLQTGFALLCAMGALREWMFKPALTMIVVIVGGLALGRAYSTMMGTEAVAIYTQGAIAFEFATAVLAAFALRNAQTSSA